MKKRLKAIHSTTVEDALDHGIYPKNKRRAPPGVLQSVWRRGNGIGRGVDLAWYRGHHAGIYDAFLTINNKYPKAARELREAFGLDEDGVARGTHEE